MNFDVNTVLNVAVSMFLVMIVGYFLRKKDVIDAQFSKKLSKLVLHVTQPALIVSSMIKLQRTTENTKILGQVLLISLGVHVLAAIIGWLTMWPIKDCDAQKLSEHSIIFANVMFMGLPIVRPLFGEEAVAWASFYSIIFHVFAWTYGMVILGRGRDDIKLDPKKVILNYGTIPCAIGVGLYFCNLKTGIESINMSGILTALDYIGGLCTPVSLLVLGGVLATHPPKRLFFDPKVYRVCLVKLIVFPLVVLMLARVIGMSEKMCLFTLIMAALPTASITNMFAELHDIQPGYAATCVGMTTAFSVITMPLVAYLAKIIMGI